MRSDPIRIARLYSTGFLLAVIMAGCMVHPRRLMYEEFYSPAMQNEMDYGVYLPSDWDGVTPLPLVVFLHGNGDDERCFDEHDAAGILDDWIRKGNLDPFIMLVPDGDRGFWRDFHDGSRKYESYVIEDLIPRIRARYPVIPGREGCHVIGVSMGGFGAMSMALHHLDTFASVTAYSGLLFDTDEAVEFILKWRKLGIERIFGPAEDRENLEKDNIYSVLQTSEDARGIRILVGAGDADREDSMSTTAAFHRHLTEAAIPHSYLVYRGGHLWIDWHRVIPVAIAHQVFGISPDTLPSDEFYTLEVF